MINKNKSAKSAAQIQSNIDTLYTTGEIAEMLDIDLSRVCYVVEYYNVKEKRRGKMVVVKGSPAGRYDKRCRLFDLLEMDERKRLRKKTPSIRFADGKSQTAIAAAKGMHDEEGTEFLKTVDKFKTDNRVRILRVSDYLMILKSLGYRKVKIKKDRTVLKSEPRMDTNKHEGNLRDQRCQIQKRFTIT